MNAIAQSIVSQFRKVQFQSECFSLVTAATNQAPTLWRPGKGCDALNSDWKGKGGNGMPPPARATAAPIAERQCPPVAAPCTIGRGTAAAPGFEGTRETGRVEAALSILGLPAGTGDSGGLASWPLVGTTEGGSGGETRPLQEGSLGGGIMSLEGGR